ncbi:cytochrome c3 family protein [Desulfobacterium sp. N47]|uniref:High-molecular-weight cytochrome c n=1 Tax=uncultured Desulfobacterium sp. TaxID=201089 RepID=E1YDG0_9BACT|nr:High-molecular-weight cytochrome c [uncultured Desulfobacterium sp.]
MNNGKHLLCLTCILAVSIVFIYSTRIYGSGRVSKASSCTKADVIQINTITAFGNIEKPTVEFLHDAHTKALAKKNKDCTVCHLTENGRIFPKFMRIKETGRVEVMNVYHKGCISCHGKMKVAGEKAGPVECDGCHRENAICSSSAQPMGFDKSLHFRHSKAEEKKCELCHHEYDEKSKKLFYAKGKEGTCRYCHKAETKGSIMPMRLASHIACINCHIQNISKNISTGPVGCFGCHARAAQQKIKKISPVPRMDMKQPDITLIKTSQKSFETETENKKMNYVPFDHKAHENYNDTCRVCHHDTLKPCNECHSLTGKKEGKEINLYDAMHRVNAGESCTGCHGRKLKQKNCSGCHALISKTCEKENGSCLKCHMMTVAGKKKILSPDDEKLLAAAMLKSRNTATVTYNENDVPEKVIIKNLSDKYEEVVFPHRRIVNALVNNIKDNKLAQYFHSKDGTICQSCHHNSPISKKPPNCGNCHGKVFDQKNPLRPGLKGAYHLQCLGCHKEMGIKKPAGCTDCHKKIGLKLKR